MYASVLGGILKNFRVVSIRAALLASVISLLPGQVDAFQGQNDSTLSAAQKDRRSELRKPVMTRWTREQIADFAGIWKRWNGYEILSRTSVPVLEIWGDRKRPHPSRAQMKIPERPNIELCWIAGASHFLPIERPAELADAINRFVQRVESSARP